MRTFGGYNRKSLYVTIFGAQNLHTPRGTNLSSTINNLITQQYLSCNSLDFLVYHIINDCELILYIYVFRDLRRLYYQHICKN